MFDTFLGKLSEAFFQEARRLNSKKLDMVTKSLYLLKKKDFDVLWDPFWALQKESADIFEIVFIGSGPATMLIFYLGGVAEKIKKNSKCVFYRFLLILQNAQRE